MKRSIKDLLMTRLRDRSTSTHQFRQAADDLAYVLASEAASFLAYEEKAVTTPLTKTSGFRLKNKIIFVPILRAGLALLPAFLRYFPQALVGFVGLKRDEQTAKAHLYYKNIPSIAHDDEVIILDPMIATGGSGSAAIKILVDGGVKEEKILFVGIISAPEGINRINKSYPAVKLLVAQHDESLNAEKFILPGLGDFGDRYFGTENV